MPNGIYPVGHRQALVDLRATRYRLSSVRRKQIGVKFPPGLVEKLDAWLVELNRDRRIPLNRSELIVGVLDWATDEHPEWERRESPQLPPRPKRGR